MRKVGRVPVSARRFDPQSLVAAPPRKFRMIFSRAAVQSRTDGSLSARTQWVIERLSFVSCSFNYSHTGDLLRLDWDGPAALPISHGTGPRVPPAPPAAPFRALIQK